MAKNTQDYRNEGAAAIERAKFDGEWDKHLDPKLSDDGNSSWQAIAYREGMSKALEIGTTPVVVETSQAGQFWRKSSPGHVIGINQKAGLALVDFAPNAYSRSMCEPINRFASRPVAWAATVNGEAQWWVPMSHLTRCRSMF